MNIWLLLERTEHLLPNLYRTLPAPRLAQLFDSTELADYTQMSPTLVQNDPDSNLLHAVEQAPEEWPGLIIHSAFSMEELLGHLRFILLIQFEQQGRGVLRYSNPTTASYFFPACNEDEARLWLGPISRLSWHGATWPEHAVGQLTWQGLDNPAARDWRQPAAGHEPTLSNGLESVLHRHRAEHLLYLWWRRHPQAPWPQAHKWLTEGLASGATHPAVLEVLLSSQLQSFLAGQEF